MLRAEKRRAARAAKKNPPYRGPTMIHTEVHRTVEVESKTKPGVMYKKVEKGYQSRQNFK
jgi:hypothetical protein